MLMNYELHINSNHGFIKLDDGKLVKKFGFWKFLKIFFDFIFSVFFR